MVWQAIDLKKLENPNVKKELNVRFAKLQAVCAKYQQLGDPKDLTKLKDCFEEFADANEALNNLIKTLLKK